MPIADGRPIAATIRFRVEFAQEPPPYVLPPPPPRPPEPPAEAKPAASLEAAIALCRNSRRLDVAAFDVRITAEDSKMGGTQVYVKMGETYPLGQLMLGVAVASANDAAMAVAACWKPS